MIYLTTMTMENTMIRQGDIISYQDNYCVCLSNTSIQRYSNIVIVAPIIKSNHKYPLYYPLSGYKVEGLILIDQLKSLEFTSIRSMIVDSLNDEDLANVLHLSKLMFDNERTSSNNVYVRVSQEQGSYYLSKYQDKPRMLLDKKEISKEVYDKYQYRLKLILD